MNSENIKKLKNIKNWKNAKWNFGKTKEAVQDDLRTAMKPEKKL